MRRIINAPAEFPLGSFLNLAFLTLNYMKHIRHVIESKTMASIAEDIAQIFFASMFIESFLHDRVEWVPLVAGLALAIIFWSISIIILNNIKLL